ncbi:hypothetical protein QYF36_025361 [Acer negundo]|nr:hypothetical protein QYF36_025361 [Acer negundo]
MVVLVAKMVSVLDFILWLWILVSLQERSLESASDSDEIAANPWKSSNRGLSFRVGATGDVETGDTEQ